MESTPYHPYYPLDAYLPHFRENDQPLGRVLFTFGLIVVLLVFWVWSACRLTADPPLKRKDLWVVCWFALCGFLHCVFEGYFVLNHSSVARKQTLFAQVWKEYALSDSRYLTSDPFLLCIETVTALVWGPLCWATVLAINHRSYIRHPLQITLCVAHLYGVVLYYYTTHADYAAEGIEYSRPEFLYYWVYYVGFNAPWVVVPMVLLKQSIDACTEAFKLVEKEEMARAPKKYY